MLLKVEIPQLRIKSIIFQEMLHALYFFSFHKNTSYWLLKGD